MRTPVKPLTANWRRVSPRSDRGCLSDRAAEYLLRAVDAGLASVICIAPFFFGGRHDLGRLLLVLIIGATAAAWFARQAIGATTKWRRTGMDAIFLIAAAWLLFQITPLPPTWIERLAPRTTELLPMWSGENAPLGHWQTVSFTPHETAKSLAMLIAYGLLFAVVAQRIGDSADVRRLLRWIAIASALMAGFGLLQYFMSNGRFFWFYEHPFRSTAQYVTGSFINRNHFASFLVLGIGPLAGWLLGVLRDVDPTSSRKPFLLVDRERVVAMALAAALALIVFAVLCSLSRGGAIAMVVAATVFLGVCLCRKLLDARYLYGLFLFGVAIVGLLSCYGHDRVARRLDDFAGGSMDSVDYDDGRRKIWAANVDAFRAAWVTGAGAGSHREIYPIYMPETHLHEYTHAENGYLQIATETGVVGVGLLISTIGMCAAWCLNCLRFLSAPRDLLCFGGCAAGLVASAVHSTFDFVWYIPACMSVTVILAACTMRLSQLAVGRTAESLNSPGGQDCRPHGSATIGTIPRIGRARWLEIAAAAVLLGGWMVHTYFGPAIAAIHWDRYLRASVADCVLSRRQLTQFMTGKPSVPSKTRQALSDVMLDELRSTVRWDPRHASAHARLADRLMADFELRAAGGANAMDVTQIREAALNSAFMSPAGRREWLERAFGDASRRLYEALEHAHYAVSLCPLRGDAYLYLADVCFLEGASREAVKAYVDQGLQVRPYDKSVLFRAGRQELFLGEPMAALDHWSKCFHTPGGHREEIVYRLVASGMPASEFIAKFRPNWPSLRDIWASYRDRGSQRDREALVAYAAKVTARQISEEEAIRPESIWYWQAMMYADAGRAAGALACLERAHDLNPRQFHVRFALQKALLSAKRYAEAESHVRWCMARRPADKSLTAALMKITKHRYAERGSVASDPTADLRSRSR
jgi:O-antigen ligase/tetratricopeptide (TPR) repeat protein